MSGAEIIITTPRVLATRRSMLGDGETDEGAKARGTGKGEKGQDYEKRPGPTSPVGPSPYGNPGGVNNPTVLGNCPTKLIA